MMQSRFEIQGRSIGLDQPPFVIAEMSGNHNHSLERALEIVDAAAASGVHALKIQTYTADTITLDIPTGDFVIRDPKSLWHGRTLHSLYAEAYTPWEWHKAIFERAAERGIIAFSTPFDFTSVDFLEELDVPVYKIASFENVHLPLIKRVAQTGKPIIMSTGMANAAELHDAVAAAREGGCEQLVLLKCTSSYPSSPISTNLRTIPHMRELFDCEVGLSDHTLGVGVAVASIALGATVVEKHFTLSRADGGVDSAFSLEPSEMSELVRETRSAWEALGEVSYGPTDTEVGSLQFRQSIYISQPVKAGDVLDGTNMRIVRPGSGMAPKFWDTVVGRCASRDAEPGTPVTWEMVR